jgi:phage-related protein
LRDYSAVARESLTDCANFGTLSPVVDRTKKLPARFYVNAAGRKPVREWILQLPEADRYVIGKDIQKVEFGWPIGRPHCAPLGSGLWEVRSALAGNRISRVIFCMDDGCMILLHGFVKKTQKTPQADIDLALKRKSEVGG